MDKYLTEKAKPTWFVRLAEKIIVLGLLGILVMWVSVGVYGFTREGFVLASHGKLLLVALPFVLLLLWQLKRLQTRSHAHVLVKALYPRAGEAVSSLEVAKLTGLRDPIATAASLLQKGLLQHVEIGTNSICLIAQEHHSS